MVAAQDPHAELLHRFRRYLEMEEGRSPRTAKEYLLDVGLFSAWYRERYGRPPRWEEIGSQHLRAFLASREVSPHRAAGSSPACESSSVTWPRWRRCPFSRTPPRG